MIPDSTGVGLLFKDVDDFKVCLGKQMPEPSSA